MVNEEYYFGWRVYKCHLDDCNYIWLEEEDSYKHCPMCGAKYKAKVLESGYAGKLKNKYTYRY